MRNSITLCVVLFIGCLLMGSPVFAAYPEANSGFQMPMVNDHYGYEFTDYAYYYSCGYLYHPGVDLNGPGSGDYDLGTLLRAMSNGIVVADGDSNNDGVPESYGSLVIACQYKTAVYYWRFFHCRKIYVQSGSVVTKGQVIAEMGNIGASSSHLHVEVCIGDYSYGPVNGSWPCSVLTNENLVEYYYRDPVSFVASHGPYVSDTSTSTLEWNYSSSREDWSASGSFTDRGVIGGVWYLIANGPDPYVASPFLLEADRGDYLVIRAMLRGSYFDVYVDTDKTSGFTSALYERYKTLNGGLWAVYTIPLADIVPEGHKPERIRIDSQGSTGLQNGFDYIYLRDECPLETNFGSLPISLMANSASEDYGLSYGNWKLQVTGSDPYIYSSQFSGYATADPEKDAFLIFRARLDADFYEIFPQTNKFGSFSPERRYRGPVVNPDGWAWYTQPLSRLVPDDEILTRYRIDYSNRFNSINYFDTIYISDSSPFFVRYGIDDWSEFCSSNADLSYVNTVDGSYVAFRSTGPEPEVEFRQFTAAAGEYGKIRVYIRSSGSGHGTVYFQTASEPFYTSLKSQDYYIPADGQWHEFELDFRNNKRWQGTITKLKVALTDRTGLDVHLKEIGLLYAPERIAIDQRPTPVLKIQR
ncbi:M23 family metallopeptidase [Patescibacteria group bacterium]